jgi:hypothetical protein
MKSPVYTLGNEEFAFFVNRAGEILRENSIPHIIVGGIATQAHVLDRLCRHYQRDAVSITSDESLRDQDFLRATDAVDLALRFKEYDALEGGHSSGLELKHSSDQPHITTGKRINDLCDAIVQGGDHGDYLSCTGEHIFTYGLERGGIQRPVFSVLVDRRTRSPIYLKVSRRPEDLEGLDTKLYNEFIESGVDLEIPYSSNCSLKLRVLRPEHLLAVKIALDRPKDAMDVRNLVHAMRLVGEFDKRDDFPKVLYQLKRCLLPNYERHLINFVDAVGIDDDIFAKKEQAE